MLISHHPEGAGESDAVFYGKEKDSGIKGFVYNNTLQFELGTEFPWYLEFLYESYTRKQHPFSTLL